MDARIWASAKHLLADVIDLPPAERRAYIEAHCSDAAVRRELLAMLDAPVELSDVVAAAAALRSGTRFGPYEIVELIGAGGMGEVYRAHDSRLNRLVAVKVLRPEIAAESAAGSRFDREARIIAALNHPRICTLHDVGDDHGIRYLVMEFVEGETLSDRVARGSLSITQLTEYAIQIADALEFAHSKGFVHRDLKPANIMITKSGAKLLDFGIAKLRRSPGLGEDPPTVELTGQGTMVGTPAYMAPEQLQGQQVDARTDIWAFGAVLYELMTRKRAFQGDSPAMTMAAILERDPTPVSTQRPDAPALVSRIISRCLVKDPDKRWQSITDVRTALEWVAEGLGDATPRPVASRSRAGLPWALAAVGLAASAFMVIQSVAARHEAAAAMDEEHVQIVAPATSDPYSLAISPDGRSLVFSVPEGQTNRLWLRSLSTGAARPIDGTDRASSPFWAPDGTSIGFFADGQLKRLDLPSGAVRSLARAEAWRGGSWGDNVIIYAPGSLDPLYRIQATGGKPVAATRLDSAFLGHRSPHFLPDGRHFLFLASSPGSWGIYASGPDMEPKKLFQADSDPIPIDSGHLLFVANGALFEQAFDAARWEIQGDPVPVVAKSVASDVGLAAVTASRSGAIAYRTGSPRKRQLEWFDRTGRPLGPVGAPDPNSMLNPDLSDDDSHVVFQRQTSEGWNLWTLDTTRGVPVRLTDDPAFKWCAIWSYDRRHIAFASNRRGPFDLYELDTSSGTRERLLLGSSLFKIPMDWSRDGKMLLYRTSDPVTGSDLWALPLDGDAKPFPVANTRFDEREGQFSPDGHWVAYQSDESGRFEIYLQRFPDGGGKIPVSLNGGAQVRWNPNGRELFYIAPDGTLMAVPVTLDSDRHSANFGGAVALFQSNISLGAIPGANKQQYMVGASGQRFLISITPSDLTNSPIDLILHWKPPTLH